MSQSNAGGNRAGRKRDRVQRWLGTRPRSSLPIGSDETSGACTTVTVSAAEAARSRQRDGGDSAPHSREQIPSTTTPGPHDDLGVGFVASALHVVVRNLPLPVPSPALVMAPARQAEKVYNKVESGDLWAWALSSLSEKDRNTLEANKTGSKLDIEEFLVAVREKREMCLKNQWEFEFRGRVVNLRYQADKIISWLAKFKEVGDTAIQYDPSHAALPWAGIRFLLQVGPVIIFCTGGSAN